MSRIWKSNSGSISSKEAAIGRHKMSADQRELWRQQMGRGGLTNGEVEAYRLACAKATKEWMRAAVVITARKARQPGYAPVGSPHRNSPRSYPSGYVYSAGYEKQIRQSIRYRVFGRDDRKVSGLVRSTVGYSAFNAYGWSVKTPGGRATGTHVPGTEFLTRARNDSLPEVMQALAGEWPK